MEEMWSNEFEEKLSQTISHPDCPQLYTRVGNQCLSVFFIGNSDCPEKYRRSVINAFVKRALTHSSTWKSITELRRVSQLLTSNGYPQKDIDDVIRRRMDAFMSENKLKTEEPSITLYYKNTMSTAHKEDEKAIKKIINNNVTPTRANTRLNLVIYYKSHKTANLIMKNSCLPPVSPLQKVNVVYQHKCTVGDCNHLNSRYIGFTTTTQSKRITAHLQDGAIRRHYVSEHFLLVRRQHIEKNTEILEKVNDIKRLKMTEAILIYFEEPTIYIQQQPEVSLPSKQPPPGRKQAVS
ncbi:hypothetical protein E2C01_030480 [Portunus trituberculatus]|uniref:Helix-turn-helix domain-containing protein n=1 Tax=Portunus trituberculatus TaxID=210409 RepID=A0A5B7EVC3_PORTR|nr:hypothetical protein [Portunus trituberculatus]